MKIITLPEEINIEKITTNLQVFDYHNSQKTIKQQIVLNQNAFSFLIEGTKEVISENSSLSIDNSKFLLMKSGHCLMTEKLSAIHNYRSILLFFSNEIILKIMRKAAVNVIKGQINQSVYAFQYDAFIQRFVASLLDISKLSRATQDKLLEVKLEEILLYLTEMNGFDFLNSLLSNGNNNKQKLIYTVESNVFSKLTIPELAFLCNMSISTFKREFEKCYSDSPMKWFQNKRLEHAHYLIHQEQKNASEIYFDIGYENLSSFIQAYKIKYGITPGQDSKN